MPVEGEGHVAGAAAEIEDDGFGAFEDGAEGARRATPPEAVDAGREEMVGAVVGGRDGREHLLDVLGGGDFGGCTGGARSGGGLVGGLGHWVRF